MHEELSMNQEESPSTRLRVLALAGLILVLTAAAFIGVALMSTAPDTLLAQQDPDCRTTDLGTLGTEDELTASGRWTTNDCDSRFLRDSDAHTYRFEVIETGRIRINLSSDNADAYLYLMNEDGARITDNDDGGAGLDARIERTLDPGIYLVEATTVGGRDRGPGEFTISVSYVEGCDIIDLGALLTGADLTASGTWNIDTCGSRFVEAHPAYGYSFTLPQAGTVRVDLVSEDGDPVLSMASASGNVIGANDDGGGGRNARIEQYLQPGIYLIEATTYLERDLQPLAADFDLTIHLVDDEEKQDRVLIKVEATDVPEEVVAGEPFTVNYRVGNLGGGDLADVGGNAIVYVVGPRVFDRTDAIDASENIWYAGGSHHSSEEMATAASTSIDELTPLEVTFRRTGPSWVFVAVVAEDEDENEVSWHGSWHNLMVVNGFTFDAVPVRVVGNNYRVSSEVDDEGEVANSVRSTASPDAEINPDTQAKAVYAAGVATQLLPDILDRPTLPDLSISPSRQAIALENPSSSTAIKMFASELTADIATQGLSGGFAVGELINPAAVEDLLLGSADAASERYSSMAGFWMAHQIWAGLGRALTFEEALDIHSQLNYAETVLAPTITAGDIVQAARAADSGWDDADVQEMIDEFASDAYCGNTESAFRNALRLAGSGEVDDLINLDAEMREALPIYGLAIDAVLCATGYIDSGNSRFLAKLSIADNETIEELFTAESPEPEVDVSPHRVRIIARLGEDGRIEHGVELSSGEQILPEARHMPADAPTDQWLLSSDVEIDDTVIGQIRTRLLDDGRVEVGFRADDGQTISPDIRYLASGIPNGVWLRSSEIEVPRITESTGQLE